MTSGTHFKMIQIQKALHAGMLVWVWIRGVANPVWVARIIERSDHSVVFESGDVGSVTRTIVSPEDIMVIRAVEVS